MKILDIVVNRLLQGVLSVVRRFLQPPQQLTFVGSGSTGQLCAHIQRLGYCKVLLVTDRPLVELGIAGRALDALGSRGVAVSVYDAVLPDPTVDIVQGALDAYRANNCDAILALGGGSSIDTAKTAAAAAANGEIDDVMGLFKAKKGAVPLFAIPTTAGTGSEASMFAVVSDPQTHQKTGVGDTALVPKATALDPELMTGLPPAITAATGMDALTHAVEGYIGTAADDAVREHCRSAVELIFANLPRAYEDGSDLAAREAMAIASYYAGLSLNTAAVGYVHAFAHQLGACYGTPHGLANAIVMPHVLDVNLDAASGPLAELAELIGICSEGDSQAQKAARFVAAIRDLNVQLGIPKTLDSLQKQDIPALVTESLKEGRTYAVPMIIGRQQAQSILNTMLA